MCELVIEFQKTKSDKIYSKIFNKYNKGLKSFLSSFTLNKHIIEDVVLISFEHARNKIDLYDPSRSFKTWFYTLSKNIMIRSIKNESLYHNMCFENGENEEEKRQSSSLALKLLEVNNDNPKKDLYDYEDVLDKINNLKHGIRDVMIDSYLNNMTFEKIMQKYNLTESQVKLKLLTGRVEIRRLSHYENLEKIKKSLNLKNLNINPILEDLIDKKLKYCGDLNITKKNIKYVIQNCNKNILIITNYINDHNSKMSKNISQKDIYSKMKNDISFAKKLVVDQIEKLKIEGYIINDIELKKAKKYNYLVSVKPIKTRNRSGNGTSNQNAIKIEKILETTQNKEYVLKISKSISNNISLSIQENDNQIIFKIY